MDSYAPCPCGSGKKIKFCCQAILPEMAKIERFQENNQPMMALQAIDKLIKSHPENGWLVTQRAMALISEQRPTEARDTLVPFLRKQPDHPLANGLLAVAAAQIDPYPASKKVIHRAFLKASSHEPHIAGMLAGTVAAYHIEQGNEMAARQHMALVMRYGGEQERQRTLMAMLEMDADSAVPYPLRGGHPLPDFEPAANIQPSYKKAMKIASVGCFEEAADLLVQTMQEHGESAELQHAVGLLRAWDGDEQRGAEALHKAAKLYVDFDRAVDLETVAQLLDGRNDANTIRSTFKVYSTDSLSRLLTRLDNSDRLGRIPLAAEQEHGLAAAYEILDRSLPTEAELPNLTLDTTPIVVGRLSLTDRTDTAPAQIMLSGIEGANFDTALQVFMGAAGELVTLDESKSPATDPDMVVKYAKDELPLSRSSFFPPKTPAHVRQHLMRDFVRSCVDDIWLSTPRPALGSQTPLQARQNPDLKVPLAAALRCFDSFLDRRAIILDLDQLREKLGLQAPPAIAPTTDGFDLNALTVSQMQQIELAPLSDEQFHHLLQRTMVVRHSGQAYTVLRHLLEHRPALVDKDPQEAAQAHGTLADICARSFRDAEALEWIQKGFQFAKSHQAPFEVQLMWKMRELSYRARDLNDPQLKTLLLELWNHYGVKLPVVRERLQEFVTAVGIDPPWSNAIVTAHVEVGGTVWTAETEQTVSTEKKLWIPD